MDAPWLSKGSAVWVAAGPTGGSSTWRRGTVLDTAESGVSVALDSSHGRGDDGVATVPLEAVQPANPALLDGIRYAR